jgi:uncharacterized protein (TIGR02099 family)
MLNSFPVRMLWHSLNWLSRSVIVILAVAVVLIASSIIALRYWLLPDIERYHDRIASSMSVAIGNPVTIGKIQGDWQGFLPHLNLTDVRILDEQGQPALVLQHIEGSLSWLSLFTAEIRLASLEIDRPELLVRRDAQGNFFIGNLVLSKKGSNNDFADWMLRQSNMAVLNALIVWVDEQRDAPPLVLQHVNMRIDRLFSQHRFALRAIPPSELATPLDVRGEFYGDSFDNMAAWHGQLFTQLDYTDVTAWRPWLDLPSQFSRGRGALRGWLGVKDGRVTQITADLDLRDVVTKLAEDVPELAMREIQGRAAWQEVAGGFEVSTRHLAMRLQNGLEFQPTDFYFRTANSSNGQPASGEIRANLLQLENLARLAKFLPMEPDLRARLDAYGPRGKVSNLDAQWKGPPQKPDSFRFKAHFDNLAFNQVGKIPGFSGLTADLNGSDARGRFNINSRGLAVDAPGVMREPLSFTTLIGQGGWRREDREWSIAVDNIAVANDDLAGNLFGSYRTLAGTLGMLDMTGKLTRGNIRRAARYTPLVALDKEGNDWLAGALLAGSTEDFRIRIKGNLSDFPLNGTKDVLFEIGGHARDAVLEFDKDWPRIENISGEFLIRGNRLEVDSPSASILDTRLRNVTVALPDMMSKDLSLEIKGEAAGASNSFLRFVQKSPVRGYIDGFTDGVSASGDGQLNLFLRIPLKGDKPVEVSGTIKVQDNNIALGEGLPMLRNTRGSLSFTEGSMQASDVSADILGGAATINVRTLAGGAVHSTIKGRSDVDILRGNEPHPLLDYLHGSTAWDADIRMEKKSATIVINSDLQGISSSLPQPFFKRADEVMALRLERSPVTSLPKRPVQSKEGSVVEGQDVISVQLGSLLNARLERRHENGAMVIKRGLISFGAPGDSAEFKRAQRLSRARDGVWLVGSLPVLSLQGWEGLTGNAAGETTDKTSGHPTPSDEKPLAEHPKDAGQAAGDVAVLPIAGANLYIEKLTGYGQSISGLHIDASRRGDGLAAQLSSSALNGEVVWEPHGYETGSLFQARLSNLQVTGEEQPSQTIETDNIDKTPPSQIHPGKLPALDASIENLQLKGKQIGHFELVGHPAGADWQLRRLNIANPDGSLVGDGIWSDADGQQRSQVNLALNIGDAGKMLARYGYPNTVKGGSGKLVANLSWAGSPDKFSFATLNGTLKLDTGKGQFLKMNPGAGKLLSVLSLQDLPKHVALGFTDVFSAGFQFDNINGNAAIKDGVIESQDFRIYGSSAKVTMKGNVDLKNETQNLNVRILPTLGDTVSMIGVFAISPAVGIGSLIVNKVLGEPLDKLASFEYNVTGTWSDPTVVKVAKIPAQPKQSSPIE